VQNIVYFCSPNALPIKAPLLGIQEKIFWGKRKNQKIKMAEEFLKKITLLH